MNRSYDDILARRYAPCSLAIRHTYLLTSNPQVVYTKVSTLYLMHPHNPYLDLNVQSNTPWRPSRTQVQYSAF